MSRNVETIELRRRDGRLAGVVKLDPEDHAALGGHPWCLSANGYAVRRAPDGGILRMHREIMGLARGDRRQVDHVNRERLDNRRANLRIVTPAQNSQNSAPRPGTSCFRGVCFDRASGRWMAYANVAGRRTYLGRHAREEDAAEVARAFRAEQMTHATN